MDPNAARDDDAEAYWRRRAAILAAGLLGLGLLAWALSGSGGSGPRSGPGPGLAQEQANRLPPAAYGSSPPASASPVMPAAILPLASGSASPSATASKRSTPRASRQALGKKAGGSCQPDSLVLTALSAKPSYGPGEQPAFDVYAVSTASRTCTFSLGAGAVRVLVVAHGRPVWDSAACRAALPPHRVSLTRGVPAQMSVTWNRRALRPRGCGGYLPAHAYGRFAVVARADGQTSQATRFYLAR